MNWKMLQLNTRSIWVKAAILYICIIYCKFQCHREGAYLQDAMFSNIFKLNRGYSMVHSRFYHVAGKGPFRRVFFILENLVIHHKVLIRATWRGNCFQTLLYTQFITCKVDNIVYGGHPEVRHGPGQQEARQPPGAWLWCQHLCSVQCAFLSVPSSSDQEHLNNQYGSPELTSWQIQILTRSPLVT